MPKTPEERVKMPKRLEERDWELLLQRIEGGKCTPFLGAGACYGVLPLGCDIAQEWAEEYAYPLEDCRDLVRVAQFLAVQYDPMFPKEKILKRLFQNGVRPDFKDDEPHYVLAELPLPVYMTTNYDDFMVQAIERRNKDPKREMCRWNKYIEKVPSVFDRDFRPTSANPVVFHLHGHNKHEKAAESLVLTEDDYLDFLVNISRNPKLLPPRIEEAVTGASLLFIGYSLADWDFRVVFRGLVTSTEPSLRRISVTVQLPPPKSVDEVYLRNGDKISGKIIEESEGSITIEVEAIGVISVGKEFVAHIVAGEDKEEEARTKQQKYLDEYFGRTDMRVYWGTAREFAGELRVRCQKARII